MRVLAVGLGESGLAVCRWFMRRGALVSASDSRPFEALPPEAKALTGQGVTLETGGHTEAFFTAQDLIVISPGVPPRLPAIEAARRKGVRITGELELAAREAEAPIYAVTGTNGKGTTVSLLQHILLAAEYKSALGGNIGHAFLGLVEKRPDAEIYVVEVSSFQLETVEDFHARAAVILNVTPDHLERYDSFEHYRDTKARIFLNQTKDDLALLNADEEWQVGLARRLPSRALWFGMSDAVRGRGAFVRDDTVLMSSSNGHHIEEVVRLDEMNLPGRHNLQNAMVAALMAREAGVEIPVIRKAMRSFRGLPHVMEMAGEIRGVRFYNNSKATNVDAAVKSLEDFEGRRVSLILGGRDKGGDYMPLVEAVARHAKRLVLVGENRPILEKAFKGFRGEIRLCEDFEEAVRAAAENLQPGDVVLLAPAASSFDKFRNYKERGEAFTKAVRRMTEERRA
jgi:UDP-N-acetylmuramoylalanine--D-glutamate ligase